MDRAPSQSESRPSEPESMSPGQVRSFDLSVYYLIAYSTIGVTLPFFPQFLKSLGLSGTQIGLVLSVGPLMALLAPPFWGHLADRTGQPGRVLFIISTGACLSFSAFLWATQFATILAIALAYGAFNSAVSTIIDSITLNHVKKSPGSYSRIRVMGSVGFAAMSFFFGRAVDSIDGRVAAVAMVTCTLGAVWAGLRLRNARAISVGPATNISRAIALAKDPQVRVFLVAVALHWMGCGPYHGALSIHATRLGLSPQIIGTTATLGVISEIVVMILWPRLVKQTSARSLLLASFLASALRWLGMAFTSNGWVLVALSIAHGFTFGVFFLAAVAFMSERAPDNLRATGQAMFVACAFGVGGIAGYLATGIALDVAQRSHTLFLWAACAEIIAALWILRLEPQAPTTANPS